MTTLYRPVLIESAEQAEALPVGTVGHEPPHLYAYIKKARNYWRGTGDDAALTDYEMLPFTALVPIEAEEETVRDISPEVGAYGPDDEIPEHYLGPPRTRYVTPWEEA